MSKRLRRNRTPEQKAAILKRHHLDKVPVSQLCNENELQPTHRTKKCGFTTARLARQHPTNVG